MPRVLHGVLSVFYENPVLSVSCLGIGLLVYGAIWRLYMSPIARFPGPRLAALTLWNEFYYDVVLGGQYTWKIAEYHAKYGPIVRINPYEIHINDPDFYNVLYVGGHKRKSNKWSWSMRMFGQSDLAVFDTLEHEKHRMRREPWQPYFSRQSVSRLQPLLIQPLVNKFCDRLAVYQAAEKPVVMTHAFGDLTSDLISEYSFPQGYGSLDRYSEFQGNDYNALMELTKLSPLLKQFGWLFPLLNSIPLWITKYTSPGTYLFVRREKSLIRQAKDIINNRAQADRKENTARPSMMHAILDSNLPPSEKTIDRIKGESQTAMAAGTLTTTHALKAGTYHILSNPSIREKLIEEVQQAMAENDNSSLDLHQLEQMQYLMAIWYETLRIGGLVSQRLQRIFPNDALQYGEWVIPPNTPVSMTAVHIHENEDIFPDHRAFKPERWLPLQTEGQRLLKYMVAFGAGSRSCVGRELGKAEFLTTVATMFGRFEDMQLWDTHRERDIDVKHDYFNPAPSHQSNGLMISFHKR
ncbi:MAG: hypothetical protein Q9201_005793 [Fulgogasparrea decipioides]